MKKKAANSSPTLINLLDPIPPDAPFLESGAFLAALIPHNLQIRHLGPIATAAAPARFTHQADQRFLLGPALLRSHVGKICGTEVFAVVAEEDADAVCAEGPVERVRRGGEGREEGDGDGKGGKLGEGDGREACVIEGSTGDLLVEERNGGGEFFR